MGNLKGRTPSINFQRTASRRRILKVLGLSALTIASENVIPHCWKKPAFQFGTLPVHAQTSGEEVEDPTGSQGCNVSLILTVFFNDTGEPLASDESTPLVHNVDAGDSFPILRYQVTVTETPPDGSSVFLHFADGTISAPLPTSGGVAEFVARVTVNADYTTTPWMQRVYATYDCGQSNTWVRPLIDSSAG